MTNCHTQPEYGSTSNYKYFEDHTWRSNIGWSCNTCTNWSCAPGMIHDCLFFSSSHLGLRSLGSPPSVLGSLSSPTPLVDEQVPTLLQCPISGRVLLPGPLLIDGVISGYGSAGSSTAVTQLAGWLKADWLLLVSWESTAFIIWFSVRQSNTGC